MFWKATIPDFLKNTIKKFSVHYTVFYLQSNTESLTKNFFELDS